MTVLLSLGILTAVMPILASNAGYLSVDEIVYHLMTRSLAQWGTLDILNGYESMPSAALSFPVAHAIDGRLVPQYPYLFPVLALPFYQVAGYLGLFVLNALAFVAALWLCFALAGRLFHDRVLALNACLIFALCTYAWEYSQAAWPHAVSVLFVLGAVYATVCALDASGTRQALLYAFVAGLLVGFGAGVRIDVFFAVPAVVLPFLFAARPRVWPAVVAILGTVPGLATLAATNYVKFGIGSPFSYGPKPAGGSGDPMSYLPVLFAGAAAVAVIWAASRPRFRDEIRGRGFVVVGAAALVVLGLSAVPEVWQLARRLGTGAYMLIADLRIRDLAIAEGGLSRGPSGGMVYMGALKKSLLQSCPYLMLLLIPMVRLARSDKGMLPLIVLSTVPAVFVGVFSFFAWHGGLSLNLRYFMPILPFTSILAAYGWRALTADIDGGPWSVWAGAATALVFAVPFALVLPLRGQPIEASETMLLTAPLLLSLGLAGALVLWMPVAGRARAMAARVATGLAMAAFVWSAVVALGYDFPRAWAMRSLSVTVSQQAAKVISHDGILLTDDITPLSRLQDFDKLVLADVSRDDLASFRSLLEFHLAAGRPAYAWLRSGTWQKIEERGLLGANTTITLTDIAGRPFSQILAPPSGHPLSAGPTRPGARK